MSVAHVYIIIIHYLPGEDEVSMRAEGTKTANAANELDYENISCHDSGLHDLAACKLSSR